MGTGRLVAYWLIYRGCGTVIFNWRIRTVERAIISMLLIAMLLISMLFISMLLIAMLLIGLVLRAMY